MRTQENLRHELKENMTREEVGEMLEREREIVVRAMENKVTDNILKGARRGRELHQLKGRLFWRLRRDEERRKFNNTLRERLERRRGEVQRDHKNQVRAIRIEKKKEDRMKLPGELSRYKKVKVFQPEAKRTLKPGQAIGPMVVGLEEDLLGKDEIAALCRGPKFCVRRIMDEERFLVECEKSYFKVRLEMNDEDDTEEPGEGEKETEEERIERERIEKEMEIVEIEAKTVFNEEENTIDYGKKRATDCKHNTCVKLPGPKSTKVEEGIEFRRMSWKKIYRDFRGEFTDEKGVQESNLTDEESRGLEKLKKRVKAGELVVVRTDKSGKFSIMSIEEYRRAGEVHTINDSEVTVAVPPKEPKGDKWSP